MTMKKIVLIVIAAVAGPYGTVTAGVATTIANTFYEDVCEYYKQQYGHD